MVEDLDDTFTAICGEIELSLSDLLLWWLVWIQFELLGHFLDVIVLFVLDVSNGQVTLLSIEDNIWIISD